MNHNPHQEKGPRRFLALTRKSPGGSSPTEAKQHAFRRDGIDEWAAYFVAAR